MRDPENPKENWKDLQKVKQEVVLLSEEDQFRWYVENSVHERERCGIRRVNGVYSILNLDTVKALPEWKKKVLRELMLKK